MFNRILIALYLLHLLLDGYLRIEEKGTSLINYIIFPLLFLGLIYSIIQRGFILSNAVFSFLLFFLFVYLSFLFSDLSSGEGVVIFENLVSVISVFLWPSVFLYFSQQKFDIQYAKSLFRFIEILGIFVGLNCLIPFVFYLLNGTIVGEFVIVEGKIRSFGFLTDQVGFALIYFLVNSLYKRQIASVIFYAIAIVATGTRGAILIGVLSCLVTLYYRPGMTRNLLSKINTNVILAAFVFYLVFFSGGISTLMNIFNIRFDSSSVEHTSVQRIGAMKSGVSIFLDNPVFGVGYGNFSTNVLSEKKLLSLFDGVMYGDDYETRAFANAQNQAIDIAANGGIIALLATIFFLYFCIKRIRFLIRSSILPDQFRIVLLYLVCMLLFNQSAIYLFNFGVCSFLLMTLLGIANASFYEQPVAAKEEFLPANFKAEMLPASVI